ncbi:MAG: WD40 repeat domain-containing protein, partial [Proteobacteria bacterium]|nr:WD40 repeat domain-containing protein [Pseudomonadota bacterium]
MKKVLFPILLICGIVLIILTLYLVPERDVPDTLHFDSPQWHLPEGVKARIGSGRVNVMQYSPDGSLLAVGSDIGVWIYDTHTTEPRAVLAAHSSVINGISFTPDGETLAAACEDGTIRVWDISTGEQKQTFTRREYKSGYSFRSGVDDVSFTPDGRTLASVSGYHLDLWDIVTGTRKESPTAHESRDPDSIDRLPYIILTGWNGTFSPDRKTLASWREDAIQLWDITTRKQGQTITVERKNNEIAMALSPDRATLATVCKDEPIRLWDVHTGLEKHRIKIDVHTLWTLPQMAFSPDGTTLAVCNVDENIRLWDVNGGKTGKTLSGHKHFVGSVAFSPDS